MICLKAAALAHPEAESKTLDGLTGTHPNDNTATVWLKTRDLIALPERHGTRVTRNES